MWIVFAFACPILHGIANLLDNYLTDKVFKNISTLVYYSSFFNIGFLPIVFFVGVPSWPEPHLIPVYLAISLIEVLYLYPYLLALKKDDTSVVISLFSLGKIIVPVLAFFLVGEVLTVWQYVGFVILLLAGSLLTIKSPSELHWNKSFAYMFGASLLLSVEAVLYKYSFEEVGWVDGFFWTLIGSFLFAQLLLLSKKRRRDIKEHWVDVKKMAPIFALEEVATSGGTAASTYALSVAPATIVKSIEEFQPVFVLLYAMLLKKLYPHYFREEIDRKSIVRKIHLFGVMMIGILMIME